MAKAEDVPASSPASTTIMITPPIAMIRASASPSRISCTTRMATTAKSGKSHNQRTVPLAMIGCMSGHRPTNAANATWES